MAVKKTEKIRKDKPTPFRLGEYKAPLQRYAFDKRRSLHWVVVQEAIKDFVEKLIKDDLV